MSLPGINENPGVRCLIHLLLAAAAAAEDLAEAGRRLT
jgi:hypothetical protein